MAAALYRLQEGNFSSVKGVGSGVFERKIDFGPGYRVYFGKDGETIVILLGGSGKQRQREAIVTAQERWADYKRRKGTRRRTGLSTMALTRNFKQTIVARAQRDPRFREALFTEAINAYLAGDTAEGKAMLRDLVNATVGFEQLAVESGNPARACTACWRRAATQHGQLLFHRQRPAEKDSREAARHRA